MDRSSRLYLFLFVVLCFVFGSAFYFRALFGIVDEGEEGQLYIYAVVGVFLLLSGGLTLLYLAWTCVYVMLLARLSDGAWRRLLSKRTKSFRYRAARKHLRGMIIGAVFFGGLFAMAVGLAILAGLGLLPQNP